MLGSSWRDLDLPMNSHGGRKGYVARNSASVHCSNDIFIWDWTLHGDVGCNVGTLPKANNKVLNTKDDC